jgi:hypothetical protein
MLRWIKSCRLSRVEMGSVGYFSKPNSIRIIVKIIGILHSNIYGGYDIKRKHG